MSTVKDPFESYLQRASDLFNSGDVVKAGQIWQAILKKDPKHEAARAGLYKVKQYFDARATQDGLGGVKLPVPESQAMPAAPVAPAAPMVPPPSAGTEIPNLLEQGCVLYDAGHAEDAIRKWEQVLQMDPQNAMAKGYITGARRVQVQSLENAPLVALQRGIRDTADLAKDISSLSEPKPQPPAVQPSAPPAPQQPAPIVVSATMQPAPPVAATIASIEPDDVDVEKLLRDGCTLYDMGQVEDALKKWERALIAEPGHALTRAYVKDARKELGLPALEEGAIPEAQQEIASSEMAPAVVRGSADDEHLEQLIREGVQLFDMGMTQEASQKWKQVLDISPEHQDAKAYLAMAEREQSSVSSHTPSGAPPSAGPKIPSAPKAQTRAFGSIASIEMDTSRTEVTLNEHIAEPVAPPKALTTPTPAATRKGLELPKFLQSLSLPPGFNSPKVLLGGIIGIVVLIGGIVVIHKWRVDVQLRESVVRLRAEALLPVTRNVAITSLETSPEELLREGERSLDEDPLVAYFNAQELIRINPGDAAASQLLDRSRGELVKIATSSTSTVKDYDQQLQQGDLDSANKTITVLLAQFPEDPNLKARAARLLLALAQLNATKGNWDEAEAFLKRGCAMFPLDKSWKARMKLLAHIQQLPKKERPQWVQLLG